MVQKVLIINGLKFGDRKTQILMLIYMSTKLLKAMISLNIYERCCFKVRETTIFCHSKSETCWQRTN